MTETNVPAAAGAQPVADANQDSVDAILNGANTQPEEPQQAQEPEQPQEQPKDDPWPKKAINAMSRRDKTIGRQRAEIERLMAENARLANNAPNNQQPKQAQPAQTRQPTNGEPQEKDFTNYHDYIRALNKFDAEQLISQRESRQQETQKNTQEQAWVTERERAVATKAQEFLKEVPDAQSVIEEYADLADEFPPAIQRLFLEADNAPLAFYNLAKEGKLEALASMSPARAAMEIGRAEAQAITKPQTKAPAPLPASRGSVPGSKPLGSLTPKEAWNLVNPKD